MLDVRLILAFMFCFQQIHDRRLFKFRIVQTLINVCVILTLDDAIKHAKNNTSKCNKNKASKICTELLLVKVWTVLTGAKQTA